jgi:hypothetical protein
LRGRAEGTVFRELMEAKRDAERGRQHLSRSRT